ncbi:YhgE/Pip domain-containing protein [uncultured Clostridium sp.]|uniref:YhgE/Pip domain-containing protein n=1 Tax=uncultured Clostridium sp. TaxID=59620 RepID=UPI0025CEEEBE|nr:YhgE/Pip domain-containing protein [uncultured Clostridium sp.]
MRNIIKIIKKDFKNIITNWVAVTIVLGLIAIPSLYAIVNIFASWDPYSSTSGIKVAVVNEDQGTVFKDKEINLGDQLIYKLKDNNKMGWQFVDRETADNGLLMEEYYASIIIPEDFSKKTTTLVEKNVEKPKLIYTANEKKNPITPKFTDSAVKTLKSQLDENIVKTISGIVFRTCNEVGINLENNRSELRRIMDAAYELDDNMPKLGALLDSAVDGTVNASELMVEIDKLLPIIDDVSDASETFLIDNLDRLDELQSEIDELSPNLKDKLVDAEQKFDSLSVILSNLDENVLPEAAKKALLTALDTTDAMQTTAQGTRDQLKKLSKVLNKLAKIEIPKLEISDDTEIDENIKNLMKQYNKQVSALESMQKNLKDMNKIIIMINNRLDTIDERLGVLRDRINNKIEDLDNGEKLDKQFLTDTVTLVNDIHDLVADIIDDYSTDFVKDINSEIDLIRNVGDNSLTLLGQGKAILPDLENLINTFIDISNRSHDELVKLQEDFPDLKEKIHKLSSKIKEFDNKDDIDEILGMITNNWETQSDFMANPVEIDDNRLFPWPNYGSTATPFYTILCLWIGGYMLSILLGTEVHAEEEEEEYKRYEVYFGRMALFVLIGIFQAIVASMGVLLLLKVYAVHPVMFVFYAIFVSIVFMVMIYTAVSLFGHGGIVIGIVLLVVQVAASSANFPIEVNPRMFQIIYPYLPFTYAINGMRQIMAGIVYSILLKDIAVLMIFMIVSLIIGITFKKVSNKCIKPFVDKLKESKLVI